MSEDGDGRHLLDGVVEAIARAVDAVGGNGRRLRWKWHAYRTRAAEQGAQREVAWRAARGKHKMCPECRALVDRNARACPDCGAALGGVRAPGVGRMLSNAFPGVSSMTAVLLLVNGFWFVMMLVKAVQLGHAGGLFSGFDIEMLVRFGAGLSQPRALGDGAVTGGEWWRIVTPIFLHGGLLHFAFNSYFLLQIGPLVEQLYGTPRAWVVYLACGLAGSAASQLPRFIVTVGASGALLGLVGLLLVYGWRNPGGTGDALRSAMLRYLVIIGLFGVLMPGIDNMNHLGGLIAGAALGFVVPPAGPAGARRGGGDALWQGLALVGVLLVLAAFLQVARFGALHSAAG